MSLKLKSFPTHLFRSYFVLATCSKNNSFLSKRHYTMPTVLQSEVRTSIEKILKANTESSEHIPIDVYRTLRDEVSLLFEREFIRDTLDSDPFECFKDKDELLRQVKRAKVCEYVKK